MAKTFSFLGDSLTEGYGVSQDATFPQLIQQMVIRDKLDWKIVGAGSSGSTTASALSRLKWIAKDNPDYVMILLGSNDGLRGFKIPDIEKNLNQTLDWAKKNNLPVMLGQLHVPLNYGKKYQQEFAAIYPKLAKKYNLALAPYLLEKVYGRADLNLPDGVHPNEKGYKIIANDLYQFLKPYLK